MTIRLDIAVAVIALAGCGGQIGLTTGDGGELVCGGSGATCSCYTPPTSTNLSVPTASFKTDVMPIFHNYCDSCHNTEVKSGGLYLGTVGSTTDAANVYAGLVGKPGADLQQMALVSAGDWSQSFLMHKVDGDQCGFAEACTVDNCGTLMPQGNTTPLPEATRDTIRRWIQQGAQDN